MGSNTVYRCLTNSLHKTQNYKNNINVHILGLHPVRGCLVLLTLTFVNHNHGFWKSKMARRNSIHLGDSVFKNFRSVGYSSNEVNFFGEVVVLKIYWVVIQTFPLISLTLWYLMVRKVDINKPAAFNRHHQTLKG